MEFIETTIFTKQVHALLSDEDYSELQEALILNPLAGSLIRGSGGLRKIRWFVGASGKRGGVRIIYYFKNQ
jgi:mRNA-degrading endonuclease RelE of RelBE toxin-antitoxin system